MKKVLLLSLALVIILGMTSSGTFALFSDTESSIGNTITAWASQLWTQTTEEDFNAGVPNNVAIIPAAAPPTGNGDVVLMASESGSVTDEYNDYTMIASHNNIVIIGGQVQLDSSGTSDIMTSRPVGDSSIELSRNTENRNYKCVDEVSSDSDTTYVYAPKPGGSYLTDLYRLGFTPNGNMTKVTVFVIAKATSDTEITYVRTAMETGSTVHYGPEESLTTDYKLYQSDPYYVNPSTGNPWTQGEVQSLLVGVSLKSNGDSEARCTQVYVEVTYGQGGFLSPGTLTSINLLSGISNGSIDSFTYWAPSIPASTSMTVQFSQDGTNWYDSAGNPDPAFDTMSEGTHTIDLTALGWSGPYFYYRITLITTDNSYTPVLEYITVNYSSSYLSGNIASQVFDTGIAGATWDALIWDETLPAGTDITFEVRASDTPFLKDDAAPTWTDLGSADSPIISGLPAGQYMQWRATLTTSDQNETPVLHEVRVWYDP